MTTEIKAIGDSIKKIGDGVEGIEQRLDTAEAGLKEATEAVEALEKKDAYRRMGGHVPNQEAQAMKGFEQFLRKGDKTELGVKAAGSIGSDSAGGYTVIAHLDKKLIETIAETNPILRDSGRVVIGSNEYQQVFTISGAVSGRVAESATRNETDAPVYARSVISLSVEHAYPKVTVELAMASSFNILDHVVNEIVTAFDSDFESEMLTGSGTAPAQKGMLVAADSTDSDDVRAFGSYQLVPSTVSGTFNYIDLVTMALT